MSKNTTPAAETRSGEQPRWGGSFKRGADGKLERIEATASASPAQPQDDAGADGPDTATAEQEPAQKSTGPKDIVQQGTAKKDSRK